MQLKLSVGFLSPFIWKGCKQAVLLLGMWVISLLCSFFDNLLCRDGTYLKCSKASSAGRGGGFLGVNDLVESVMIAGSFPLPDHLPGLLGDCCGWRGNMVPANPVALAVQRHFHLYDHL